MHAVPDNNTATPSLLAAESAMHRCRVGVFVVCVGRSLISAVVTSFFCHPPLVNNAGKRCCHGTQNKVHVTFCASVDTLEESSSVIGFFSVSVLQLHKLHNARRAPYGTHQVQFNFNIKK